MIRLSANMTDGPYRIGAVIATIASFLRHGDADRTPSHVAVIEPEASDEVLVFAKDADQRFENGFDRSG